MSIRILCLHGEGQHGSILRSQIHSLEQRLANNHNVELIFIDSPLCDWNYNNIEINHNDTTSRIDIHQNENESVNGNAVNKQSNWMMHEKNDDCSFQDNYIEKERKTVPKQIHTNLKWFDSTPTPLKSSAISSTSDIPSNTNEAQHQHFQYIGMDASLLHVLQIWQRELYSRPFHGILAFHQGAALTCILLLAQKLKNCEFVIFASGFIPNEPPPSRGCMGLPQEAFLDQSYTIKCDIPKHNRIQMEEIMEKYFFIGTQSMKSLHLIGKNNKRIHPEKSRALAHRFHNAQVYEHGYIDDYHFPNRMRTFNVIGKFIIQCKNEIFNRPNNALIHSTQAQLALVTQKASNLIAATINERSKTNDLPKSLMAVIAPNTMGMGGWSGPKVQHLSDGGGAPCPSEFVKRKEDREKDS